MSEQYLGPMYKYDLMSVKKAEAARNSAITLAMYVNGRYLQPSGIKSRAWKQRAQKAAWRFTSLEIRVCLDGSVLSASHSSSQK